MSSRAKAAVANLACIKGDAPVDIDSKVIRKWHFESAGQIRELHLSHAQGAWYVKVDSQLVASRTHNNSAFRKYRTALECPIPLTEEECSMHGPAAALVVMEWFPSKCRWAYTFSINGNVYPPFWSKAEVQKATTTNPRPVMMPAVPENSGMTIMGSGDIGRGLDDNVMCGAPNGLVSHHQLHQSSPDDPSEVSIGDEGIDSQLCAVGNWQQPGYDIEADPLGLGDAYSASSSGCPASNTVSFDDASKERADEPFELEILSRSAEDDFRRGGGPEVVMQSDDGLRNAGGREAVTQPIDDELRSTGSTQIAVI
jgi:hypothetical protein